MDSDAMLTEIRRLAAIVDSGLDDTGINIQIYYWEETRRLLELFRTLDQALADGGLLPAAWVRARADRRH